MRFYLSFLFFRILAPSIIGSMSLAQPNFTDVVSSCGAGQADRFQVCQMVQEFYKIEEQTLDSVRRYMPMGPYQAALLSATNAMVTQRIQWRTQILNLTNTYQVLDLQRDQIRFLIEKRF